MARIFSCTTPFAIGEIWLNFQISPKSFAYHPIKHSGRFCPDLGGHGGRGQSLLILVSKRWLCWLASVEGSNIVTPKVEHTQENGEPVSTVRLRENGEVRPFWHVFHAFIPHSTVPGTNSAPAKYFMNCYVSKGCEKGFCRSSKWCNN